MAKSKPIGVRFDLELLSLLKEKEKIDTPQTALNFLTDFYNKKRKKTEEVEQYKSGKQNHTEFIEKMGQQSKSDMEVYYEVGELVEETQPKTDTNMEDNLLEIEKIKSELLNPPAKFSSLLAKKTYFYDRNKRLKELGAS